MEPANSAIKLKQLISEIDQEAASYMAQLPRRKGTRSAIRLS